MIPKIIHYCWFGRNPLPESANKCIDSWRKFFPDYVIKEWNEDNFDINAVPYTRQAYDAKKYAFVSDYARFWILYHYGGLYFDTDVEVIKPMNDIVNRGPFMGVEVPAKGGDFPKVAPGLGLGVSSGHALYKELLDLYSTLCFRNEDGSLNQKTIVFYTSQTLLEHGLLATNEMQNVAGIWVYPVDFFNPLDSLTGRLCVTERTRTIHWYMNSWSDTSRVYKFFSKLSHRLFDTRINKAKRFLKQLMK